MDLAPVCNPRPPLLVTVVPVDTAVTRLVVDAGAESVLGVLLAGSESQVFGVDTQMVVAQVVNVTAWRDSPMGAFPGVAVGNLVSTPRPEPPIPAAVQATCPFPASTVIFLDAFLESYIASTIDAQWLQVFTLAPLLVMGVTQRVEPIAGSAATLKATCVRLGHIESFPDSVTPRGCYQQPPGLSHTPL